MKTATLTDVAKLANVSKMTVSRVINHPEKVTDDLKQLVYHAMQALNYRPNVIAQDSYVLKDSNTTVAH